MASWLLAECLSTCLLAHHRIVTYVCPLFLRLAQDVTSELANGTFADFASAYQCLIDFTDDLYDNFIGSTQDRSMRDALRDECNWPEPPADNSILRSVEYAIDYEVRFADLL